ncbi:MAG: phospholipid carrier-dependent glycosyltransferase [Leptolyngbyaceae cyanobacterium RU_5_1]|nr:phospholipid carrier-dependent glycosyltransferase [Leptolyngbyaceae cyanobacterium RU_5_1]
MNWFKKPNKPSFSWFRIGILGLLILSLALRFWGLGRFNTLVFDEVYYAKFAHNYLSWTPFFDGHPPLSKYIIAVGMWLGSRSPLPQTDTNGLVGSLFAPWTYRWLNALIGSFIPLVTVGIAYQLTHRRSYAFIAGLFAALDGLFLVESRYALNNVHLVIFGLLGLWCLLLALDSTRSLPRDGWLVLSGICFGMSVSIKWNGLWFLLGAYGLWVCAQGNYQFQSWYAQRSQSMFQSTSEETTVLFATRTDTSEVTRIPEVIRQSPLEKLFRLSWWQVGLYLGIVPVLTYVLIWIPHLKLNAKSGFWKDFWALQGEILSYHKRVGDGPNVHPYCSHWSSWLTMWRPVAYFYQVTGKGDLLPTERSLPPTTAEKVIYDVHAIGNPFLWWFSTIAILIVLIVLLWLLIKQTSKWVAVVEGIQQSPPRRAPWLVLSSTEQWLALFLAINYLANLLPWVRVTRCTFLYHYMGASVFASMAVAWLVDRWLHSTQYNHRRTGIAVILIVVLAFLFWLPIYLGLPLSTWGFQLRMWFRSWV